MEYFGIYLCHLWHLCLYFITAKTSVIMWKFKSDKTFLNSIQLSHKQHCTGLCKEELLSWTFCITDTQLSFHIGPALNTALNKMMTLQIWRISQHSSIFFLISALLPLPVKLSGTIHFITYTYGLEYLDIIISVIEMKPICVDNNLVLHLATMYFAY